MNKDLKASDSIVINASAEKVWETLTNPKKIKKYLFDTDTITDWKKNSPIIFQGEYQGQHYRDKGRVLEIKKNELIRYSYWSGFSGLEDIPENYSTISYTIEELEDDKVKFTWMQEGFGSEEGQKHSQESLHELLVEIKKIAEKG